MKIYLAGGISGNLNSLFKTMCRIHLAGTYSRTYVIEEAVKSFLNKGDYSKDDFILSDESPYILESFYYLKNLHEWMLDLRPFFKNFLLDSGAFTFMNGSAGKCNWDEYTEEYGSFINKYNVDLFFELDIDSIVGIKEVERLRNKLEKITGKKCIPVWHKSRGLDYWKQMVKEYNYVAIGGIVTQEIKRDQYDMFFPLLKIARENNCRVHGLGYTHLQGLKKYPFYSVDSTAWLYGNRGGFLYLFNGTTLDKIKQKGKKLKSREAAINNFNQWLKFSRYADKFL
jgi:hypothetical protein